MTAKLKWLGEEAGPDSITVFDEITGQRVTFEAGKAVDVSDNLAIRYAGNPFFMRDDATQADDAAADAAGGKGKKAT